jgi:hypothetical protein
VVTGGIRKDLILDGRWKKEFIRFSFQGQACFGLKHGFGYISVKGLHETLPTGPSSISTLMDNKDTFHFISSSSSMSYRFFKHFKEMKS